MLCKTQVSQLPAPWTTDWRDSAAPYTRVDGAAGRTDVHIATLDYPSHVGVDANLLFSVQ